jgi:hypothetical protein
VALVTIFMRTSVLHNALPAIGQIQLQIPAIYATRLVPLALVCRLHNAILATVVRTTMPRLRLAILWQRNVQMAL